MVEQTEYYQWEVTLADGTVKKEVAVVKFELAWFTPGALRKLLLRKINNSKYFSVDFTNGDFDKNGIVEAGIPGSLGDFTPVYLKRNIVRVDETGPLGNRVIYYMGYKKAGQQKTLKISPAIGLIQENIDYENP